MTRAAVQGVDGSSHTYDILDFSIVHKTLLVFSQKTVC